jgi:hypothetical protein
MLKTKTAFIALTTTSLLLFGCANNRNLSETPARTSKRHPRFIDDIAITGNTQSKIKTNIPQSHTAERDNNRPSVYGRPDSQRTRHQMQHSAILQRDFVKNDPLCIKYANILGIFPQLVTNAPLYSFIDNWYGVPYRMGGNDMSGIDCSAFVQRLYEQVFGTNVVRTAMEQFGACRLLHETDNLKEGDLVFFHSYTYSRSRRGRKAKITGKRITHVGIYLANAYFVHASTSYGVMISSLKEEYWQRKFAGAGQVPKG